MIDPTLATPTEQHLIDRLESYIPIKHKIDSDGVAVLMANTDDSADYPQHLFVVTARQILSPSRQELYDTTLFATTADGNSITLAVRCRYHAQDAITRHNEMVHNAQRITHEMLGAVAVYEAYLASALQMLQLATSKFMDRQE